MTDTETRVNGTAPGSAPWRGGLPDERAFNKSPGASPDQTGGLAATTAGNMWGFNSVVGGSTVAPAIGTGVSDASTHPPALHQGSFYEFSYEVTSNLLFGTTDRLEVTVRKNPPTPRSIRPSARRIRRWK